MNILKKFILPFLMYCALPLPMWAEATNHNDIVRAVQTLMAQYPEASLLDIYKSAFQDRFGPGHIIADTTRAKAYIQHELTLTPTYHNPPLEPTIYHGNFYRVNLDLINAGTIPLQAFFEAFLESASKVNPPTIEQWAEEWHQIVDVIQQMNLDLPNFETDRQAIDQRLANGVFQGEHSPHYVETYDPHYRIIERSVVQQSILPFINPQH